MSGWRKLLLPLGLAGFAGLAACASNPRSDLAELAQTALIGLPRSELLACAGVPPRSRVEGDREFWTYGSERLYAQPGPGLGIGVGLFGGSGNFGYGIGLPLYGGRGDLSSSYCEATFTLENDRVTRINYAGIAGYGQTRYSQCYYIVQSCLDTVSRRSAAQQGVPPAGPQTVVPQTLAPQTTLPGPAAPGSLGR